MSENNEKSLLEVEDQDTRVERGEDLHNREASAGSDVRQGSSDDDDDETWTNRPVDSEKEAHSSEITDEEEDAEYEAEEARAPRRVIQNGRDVLCEELPERAQRAAIRLKPFLTSVLVIELTDSGERFVFDWRDEAPKTYFVPREVAVTIGETIGVALDAGRVTADALIFVSEKHIMAIRSGDLNPQVGMLTDKIKVKGKVGPAVYFFNLIAPRARH